MAVVGAGAITSIRLVVGAHYPPGTKFADAVAEQNALGNEPQGGSTEEDGSVIVLVHDNEEGV